MKSPTMPLVVFTTAGILIALALLLPVKLNWYTDSLPRGIYWKLDLGTVKKGMYAATCLNDGLIQHGLERGYVPTFTSDDCTHGHYALGKQIYGVPGDAIRIDDAGQIIVNEQATSLSRLSADSQGRAMPVIESTYTLQPGQYWLMSSYKSNSWDSRYWGPVGIDYQLTPIITW